MKVYILFGQRYEDYPEQYAPEAIAVADEFTMSDNPEYIAEKEKFHRGVNVWRALEIVVIDTGKAGLDEIKNRLNGDSPVINAKVI